MFVNLDIINICYPLIWQLETLHEGYKPKSFQKRFQELKFTTFSFWYRTDSNTILVNWYAYEVYNFLCYVCFPFLRQTWYHGNHGN